MKTTKEKRARWRQEASKFPEVSRDNNDLRQLALLDDIDELRAQLAAAQNTIRQNRDNADKWHDLLAICEETIARGKCPYGHINKTCTACGLCAGCSVEAHNDRDTYHVRWANVSGALCDAGDVVVYEGDYARSVRELTAQRDAARAELAKLKGAKGARFRAIVKEVEKDGPLEATVLAQGCLSKTGDCVNGLVCNLNGQCMYITKPPKKKKKKKR
jgi:hypothetical protein